MKNLFDIICTEIETHIMNNLYDGIKLYWRTSYSELQMGDESALSHAVWEVFLDDNTENFLETYDILNNLIEGRFNAIVGGEEGWVKDNFPQTFVHSWTSGKMDNIRLQFSDECIYLIFLESGQY